MLAQILHDLYVPRELLDGLSEDQKQLLFCKMREEQIRRYYEREEEENAKIVIPMHNKKKKKHVTFRLDADGNQWCWTMGESGTSLTNTDEQLNDTTNNENNATNHQTQMRTNTGGDYTRPTKTGSYYTVHRDERKQFEEISKNIEEVRRVFKRLESETQQFVLKKENEVLQQQNQKSYFHIQAPQSDTIDETFHHEVEERAKKADRQRREIARRARDQFRRNSLQLNVCFDTDNYTKILLQPSLLYSLNKINREKMNEKETHVEVIEKNPFILPTSSNNKSQKATIEHEHHQQSKLLLPLTREDIRQWFCISEIPYGTFRSANGQIYPWFHGIISRPYTELILSSKPIGSYLIRINEKIFGYALSYRASDRCRHLLIEVLSSPRSKDNRIEEKQHAYRFLGGAKQELFSQLNQLIEKYTNIPIRSNSTDVLRYPCGQEDPQNPDYADLFIENLIDKQCESLYISLDTTTSYPPSSTHL